jgi:hypothetical protein
MIKAEKAIAKKPMTAADWGVGSDAVKGGNE